MKKSTVPSYPLQLVFPTVVFSDLWGYCVKIQCTDVYGLFQRHLSSYPGIHVIKPFSSSLMLRQNKLECFVSGKIFRLVSYLRVLHTGGLHSHSEILDQLDNKMM